MRYSLRQLFIGFTIISLLCSVVIWLSHWPYIVIPESEITEEREIVLRTDMNVMDINGLSIQIEGHLDGQAKLELLMEDALLVIGPGRFSEKMVYEYYDSRAALKYIPGDAKRGHVTIAYDFW